MFRLDNSTNTNFTSYTGIIPEEKVCDVRATYSNSSDFTYYSTSNVSLLNVSFPYIIEAEVEVYKHNKTTGSFEVLAAYNSTYYRNLTVRIDRNTDIYALVIPSGQSACASVTYSQTFSRYYWNDTNYDQNTGYQINTESSGGGLKAWQLGLIIGGAIVFGIAVIGTLTFFLARKVIPIIRRRKSKTSSNPVEKVSNPKIQNDAETNKVQIVVEDPRLPNIMIAGGQVEVIGNVESIPQPVLPVDIPNENMPEKA